MAALRHNLPVKIIWESFEIPVDDVGRKTNKTGSGLRILDLSSIHTIRRGKTLLVSNAQHITWNAFH
jgi:hypothetical protein